MNFDDLKNALSVDGQGNLTIAQGSLGTAVDTLISTCYANPYNNNHASIVIRSAAVTVNTETINVIGTSEFLNTSIVTTGATLKVTGTFSLDDKGEAQLLLRYALIDDLPSPTAGNFPIALPTYPPSPTGANPSEPLRYNFWMRSICSTRPLSYRHKPKRIQY
jgi:hypothetical protein